MALTKAQVREILSAAGISGEQMGEAVDRIIEGHVASIEALRENVAKYKAEAEKLVDIQKELEEAREVIKDSNNDGYKIKYDAVKEEFEKYKIEQSNKEIHNLKKDAYKNALLASGVSDKRIESILKITDIDSVELDKNGMMKNNDEIINNIKSEWADFIVTEQTKGAQTATPPSQIAKKIYTNEDIKNMTTEQINANWEDIKQSLKNN